MNPSVGKPKVIVFGNEQFSEYLQSKNPNWYVQPPSNDVHEFWQRIELHETNPDDVYALDPDSSFVFFQNIFEDLDEIDENVAGTASSFVHYNKVKTFAFGDNEFYDELVRQIKNYDFHVQKEEGVENPILAVDTVHLTDESEDLMLKTLISATKDVVDWSHLMSPQPTQPRQTAQAAQGRSETRSVQGTQRGNGFEEPNVRSEPPPASVVVSTNEGGEGLVNQQGEGSNYTSSTINRATQGYQKPANAIPDQLTIAVMSSKGGSGKCLRGDMLIPDESGVLRTIESLVSHGLSDDNDAVEVLTFDGEKFTPNRVVNFFRSGERETFTVRLASGRWVSATDNHPFLTAGGWKELKDLKVDETVASVANLSPPENVINPARGVVVDTVKKSFTRNFHPLPAYGGGVFKDVPDEVFSYGDESLSVFLSEVWGCFSEPFNSFVYPLDISGGVSSRFVSENSPLTAMFRSSRAVSEKLRALFLRLGIVVVDMINYEGEDLVETFNDSEVRIFVWGVADFSVETFMNNITLTPELFKECEIFQNTLHVSGVKIFNPTFDADMLANVNNIFSTNQNVSLSSSDVVKSSFLKPSTPQRSSVTALGLISADGGENESFPLNSLSLDLLKSWGIPSDSAVGHHYGWVASDNIFWDPVVSIVSDGVHETYDIEVPSVHNFVANGVIVHNSTTAMMLASTIAVTTRAAGNPKKVVLVDLDTRDGQVGTLLGQYKPTAINLRVIPTKKRTATAVLNNLVHDPKLEIDALLAPVRPRFATDIGPDFYEQIIGVLQTTHDVVIIDCSVNYLDPLLGSAFKVSDNILFVTTLALTSVQGMARALIEMTESREDGGLGIPQDKIKVVVNQVTKDVGMPAPRLLKSLLNTDVVGKIPNLPKSVLIATNEAKMWRLFKLEQLAASYIILARKCLENRPDWKMRTMENTQNFQGIKNMINSGKLLPPE